jgi:hypothetical protein
VKGKQHEDRKRAGEEQKYIYCIRKRPGGEQEAG